MRGIPLERVDWHLDNWSEYMRDQPSDYGYGYPRNISIFRTGNSQEFDSMVAQVDMHCAKVVSQCIADLPPNQGMSVLHVHLAAVFKVARANIELWYAEAKVSLAIALQTRGIE